MESMLLSDEIIRRGITFRENPPEPQTCSWCGAKLYHMGIILGGTVIFWKPTPERCTCAQAKAYWAERDMEDAAKEAADRQKRNRENAIAEYAKLIDSSCMRKRFLDRTFENFTADSPEKQHALGIARKYVDSFDKYFSEGIGLYFEGSLGTGKTHLAAAIANELLRRKIPVIFKTSSDLFNCIKATMRSDSEDSSEKIIRQYGKVDLLVIDDIGKEFATDWTTSVLFSILNARYENKIPTIITTNYTPKELPIAITARKCDRRKADAIMSRIRETSVIVKMYWLDYRQKGITTSQQSSFDTEDFFTAAVNRALTTNQNEEK